MISSIGLLLISCAGAPKFPAKYLWEYDRKNDVCGQYEIYDFDKVKIKFIKDWPADKCDGIFGFSTDDSPKVLEWIPKFKNYFENQCRQAF